MAADALDAVRSQTVGLDQFIDRWVQRLLRRKHPAPSARRRASRAGRAMTVQPAVVSYQGHYAGSVSRSPRSPST